MHSPCALRRRGLTDPVREGDHVDEDRHQAPQSEKSSKRPKLSKRRSTRLLERIAARGAIIIIITTTAATRRIAVVKR